MVALLESQRRITNFNRIALSSGSFLPSTNVCTVWQKGSCPQSRRLSRSPLDVEPLVSLEHKNVQGLFKLVGRIADDSLQASTETSLAGVLRFRSSLRRTNRSFRPKNNPSLIFKLMNSVPFSTTMTFRLQRTSPRKPGITCVTSASLP